MVCVQGALLLSEVLRERDAQLQYREKKKEEEKVGRAVADKEGERGILSGEDHEALMEKAQARNETAKFQLMQ